MIKNNPSNDNTILKGSNFIITCYIAINNMTVELIFVKKYIT